SVSAERGYLRETGNLVFHFSLIGVLIAVGVGGGTSFSAQRVLVEGETFVNNLASYDSLSPGTFFNEQMLVPFSVSLDNFEVDFDLKNRTNVGTPLDFRAYVSSKLSPDDAPQKGLIRVNEPLGRHTIFATVQHLHLTWCAQGSRRRAAVWHRLFLLPNCRYPDHRCIDIYLSGAD
ncbi:MAG: hypothetical protein RL600_1117, partial [Actinomycetota bacterium]